MSAVLVIVTFSAAVALGVFMLVLRMRGKRKPVLIGIHLLLGAGGLEQLIMVMSRTQLKPAAAGLFALALACGLVAAILGRTSQRTARLVFITHIAFGISGSLVLLASLPLLQKSSSATAFDRSAEARQVFDGRALFVQPVTAAIDRRLADVSIGSK